MNEYTSMNEEIIVAYSCKIELPTVYSAANLNC